MTKTLTPLFLFGLVGLLPYASQAAAELWENPVPGATLTSSFGPRTPVFPGGAKNHTGVDLGAKIGTVIHAPFAGKVESVAQNQGDGTRLIIDHGQGIQTIYTHLSKVTVAEGQSITKGSVIGEIGNTGVSTGPHVHFEVRKNGKAVDPSSLITEWKGQRPGQ